MVCDGDGGCGKEFRALRASTESLPGEVEKTYFTCSSCGKEFVAFYTDRAIRKKQNAIRRVTNPPLVEKLRRELAADMAALRRRIEG